MNNRWSNPFKRLFITRSLRFQLLSRSLFVLAGLLLLIGLFQYVLMKEFIYNNKAVSMQNEIMTLPRGEWLRLGADPSHNFGSERRTRPFLSNSSFAFVDMDGNYMPIFAGNDNETPPKLSLQEYQDALQKGTGVNHKIIRNENNIEQLVVLQRIEDHGRLIGLAQMSTATGPLKDILYRQLITFLLLSLTALVMGLLAFLPVLKRTLVPLSNLADAVEQINAGNLAERFPSHQGQLEIDRLAVSFNGMLERLELSFEAEKEAKEQMGRFIADASHELRTPLTSIHGFLEVLLRGASHQPDQLDKALKSMLGESERLNKLVQDLLLLAKLDRTPHIELTDGDLDTVVADMEPQLRLLAGKRKVSFNISSDMRCMFDSDKMKQVILNLYYNAVQHTDPESGHIEIILRPADEGIQLSVQDNGPGIGKQHLPYLFDRFYRSDSSRTRKYGGSGLGLSITKSIVEIHGGSIQVESKEGQGCIFHVWLPSIHDEGVT